MISKLANHSEIGVCANCGKPLTESHSCDCKQVAQWFKEHRGYKVADGVYSSKNDQIMGGLKVDPATARITNLEKRVSELEKLAYTNPSGCCCEFDKDGETVIKVCKAHAKWRDQ